MRNPIFWKDRAVEHPKRYVETSLGNGMVTLERAPGEVKEAGTPQNATNFNSMDYGIFEAAQTAAAAVQMIRQQEDSISGLEAEKLTVTLSSTLRYPFNDSKKAVQLTKSRNNANYTVEVEVVSHTGGGVGEIEISDKLLNGFKIAYTGAAESVTANCYVRGGI